MFVRASGLSWGLDAVPHDACATTWPDAAERVEVVASGRVRAGPGIVAFGSTCATRGLRASVAACAAVTRTVSVFGTSVRARTGVPSVRAIDATSVCAWRAIERPAVVVGAADERRKTIIVFACCVVALGDCAAFADAVGTMSPTAVQEMATSAPRRVTRERM